MFVLDVGSGPGLYVDALRAAGVQATGWDPFGPDDLDRRLFRTDPLTIPLEDVGEGWDAVICLETAEHIREADATAFVERLCRLAPVVYFSAAPPGQIGEGHINCQPKSYWQERFAGCGMAEDVPATQAWLEFMKGSNPYMGWLIQNGMIFRRFDQLYYDRIMAEEGPQAKRLAEWLVSQ